MLAHPANLWLIDTDLDAGGGYRTKMSPQNHSIALAQPQNHVIDPANPRGALNDGVENRLHVRGRAADDAEHLRCRRLMLQSFTQLCVALSDLFEQPHVLDGNDRLASESFEQFNMSVRKWTHFDASDVDHTNRRSFSDHRHAEICPDSPSQAVAF